MTFFIISIIFTLYFIYNRYVPVYGVRPVNLEDLESDNMNVIDIRDFDESYKDPVAGAVNIPTAYLNRNFVEIPNRDIYIVASNSLEKNIGIRFLRKKGFRVLGFTIHNKAKVLGPNSGLGERMDQNRVS